MYGVNCNVEETGASTPRKKKNHLCLQCEKFFANKLTLKDHEMRFHNKNAPQYPCTICGKSFNLLRDLNQHIRNHRNKKAFKCNLCPLAYSCLDKLNEHDLTHNPHNAQFKCECGKLYLKESIFYQHMKTHTMRYECDECGKELKSKDTLTKHKLKHSDSPLFSCDLCGKRCYTKDRLKQHNKNKHNPAALLLKSLANKKPPGRPSTKPIATDFGAQRSWTEL